MWEYNNALWDYCICEFIFICEYVRACGSVCICICFSVCMWEYMWEWGYVCVWICVECVGACESIEETMCVWVCCACDHVWMCVHAPCLRRQCQSCHKLVKPSERRHQLKDHAACQVSSRRAVLPVGSRVPAESQSHHRGVWWTTVALMTARSSDLRHDQANSLSSVTPFPLPRAFISLLPL